MRRGSWKSCERRMARDMGTERIPVTGIDRDGADFETALFCFQQKVRQMLPVWLWRWLTGICATAERKDKIGVLVLKVPGMRDADAIVMLKWRDWVALHGTTDDR